MNKLKSALCVFLLALGLPITAKEYTYQAVEGDLMNTRIYTLRPKRPDLHTIWNI